MRTSRDPGGTLAARAGKWLWLAPRAGDWRLPLAALGVACAAACHERGPVAPAADPVAPEPAVETGNADSAPAATTNPFTWGPGYRAPGSPAVLAQQQLATTDPAHAEIVAKIAAQPQAAWFGGWTENLRGAVDAFVGGAAAAGEVPLLVTYNVPNRDCGQYSSGGASDPDAYRAWIGEFAAGIGDRPAVVVLEPDALAQLTQCLSEGDQAQRMRLMAFAVDTLAGLPRTAVYLDAGHSNWVPAEEMATRLRGAGIERARGFALNVSNYELDANLLRYGHAVIALLGIDTHFIIDSSRNGNGPAEGEEAWCNPPGRALGRPPTVETGDPALDAFVWVKRPGESDGECKGGPAAGEWFAERALEMARNARW